MYLLNGMQVLFAFLTKKIIVKVAKIYYEKAGLIDDFFIYVIWGFSGDYIG